MSGTNDLKHDDVNVLDLYKLYKGKVEKFREFNPKGNIFICPVVPTKDILVRLIKLALFSVKRDKGKYTTGRSFRNVLVGGPPNPV